MNFSEVKKATDPAVEELFKVLLSEEEKKTMHGCAVSVTDLGEPCVWLFFRKSDPKAAYLAQKWNNSSVQGVLVLAEVRSSAELC